MNDWDWTAARICRYNKVLWLGIREAHPNASAGVLLWRGTLGRFEEALEHCVLCRFRWIPCRRSAGRIVRVSRFPRPGNPIEALSEVAKALELEPGGFILHS